jgi:MoaA/NifB/PqqE/SkfB family radical SAM enzyme
MDLKQKIIAGIRLSKSILKNKILRKPSPFFCQWEIIYDCNMNCDFCFIPQHKNDWKPYVNTREAFKIIDQLVKLGVVILNITGGEPLIRKDIDKIIMYAKSKGMIVFMNSNGSCVGNVKRVKGLDLMRVSIDYAGEKHDKIRRKKGAFDEAINTIKALKKAGIESMITSIVTKQHKYEDLGDLARLAKQLKTQIEFSMIDIEMPSIIKPQKKGRKDDDHKLMIKSENFIEMVKKVKKDFKKHVVYSPSYIKTVKEGLAKKCKIMDVVITIKSNGKMAIPCNGYPTNLLGGDLIKAWNSKEAENARKMQGKYWFCKDNKCYNRCALFPTMLLNTKSFLELLSSWKRF